MPTAPTRLPLPATVLFAMLAIVSAVVWRDAATTGVRFKPRFRIVGDKDATMNHSMMQMDWVRYYDLHRPNARSIKAPAMHARTYAKAC